MCTGTIFRMTITGSGRIRQLQGKAADMKRLLTKKKHSTEHEAFKVVLQSRELKEDHRVAMQQLPQLPHHHHIQKILSNGSRLLQLNHELAVLDKQQEVLSRQEEQLEVWSLESRWSLHVLELLIIQVQTVASSKFNFRRILVFDNYSSIELFIELYEYHVSVSS